MLLKIIREKTPEGLVVSFDSPAMTERHMMLEQYKANRKETPADLVQQLPHIRKVISALHIKVFEMPGYEADDIIGTIAKRAASEGSNVYIVTADKDMLQLVDDRVKVYDPMKDRILDKAYVIEKFGVGPERVTEYMALTGDASDNIPGVKGIGEKTAKDLLASFASIGETLTDDNFKREVLSSDKPVLVDFWAEWCGPCKMIAPVVEELAKEYDGTLKVGKVDVDANQKVSMPFGIRSIPTLLIFKGGRVVDQVIGAVPKRALADKISRHIN